MASVDPRLVQLAIDQLPAGIAWIKAAFSHQHPGDPEPTNEEVLAAKAKALDSSEAKDDAYLSSHRAP